MDTITVLVVKPNEEPAVVEISNTLRSLQDIVGGYFETLSPSPGACIILNDEGIRLGLSVNRRIAGKPLLGTFLVAGVDGGEFASLSSEQIAIYTEMFSLGNAD